MKSRVSLSSIPDELSSCKVGIGCIYRDGNSRCDSPRTNKGNGDAVCHRMSNKRLLAGLRVVPDDQTPSGLALAAEKRRLGL